VLINRQTSIAIDLAASHHFVKRLRAVLKLGRREFNVCFVSNKEIARLNSVFRGKHQPTDVLSFPWEAETEIETGKSKVENRKSKIERRDRGRIRNPGKDRVSSFESRISNFEFPVSNSDFRAFLGDIVVSPETARANAREEGHSTENEIRWLILHGALHLLGYDHETDHGEMTALELSLRERLGIADERRTKRRLQMANGKRQMANGKES